MGPSIVIPTVMAAGGSVMVSTATTVTPSSTPNTASTLQTAGSQPSTGGQFIQPSTYHIFLQTTQPSMPYFPSGLLQAATGWQGGPAGSGASANPPQLYNLSSVFQDPSGFFQTGGPGGYKQQSSNRGHNAYKPRRGGGGRGAGNETRGGGGNGQQPYSSGGYSQHIGSNFVSQQQPSFSNNFNSYNSSRSNSRNWETSSQQSNSSQGKKYSSSNSSLPDTTVNTSGGNHSSSSSSNNNNMVSLSAGQPTSSSGQVTRMMQPSVSTPPFQPSQYQHHQQQLQSAQPHHHHQQQHHQQPQQLRPQSQGVPTANKEVESLQSSTLPPYYNQYTHSSGRGPGSDAGRDYSRRGGGGGGKSGRGGNGPGGRGRGGGEEFLPSVGGRGGGGGGLSGSGPPRGASSFTPRGPLQPGEGPGPASAAAQSRVGEPASRPQPAPEFNMMTNDFPALPGSRETGPAKGEEPRGFLEVVKGTAKLRLDDQEGEGTIAGGGPPVEDSVVTIEPGSGEKRSAATPDLPEEFSSQSSKPGGHR